MDEAKTKIERPAQPLPIAEEGNTAVAHRQPGSASASEETPARSSQQPLSVD